MKIRSFVEPGLEPSEPPGVVGRIKAKGFPPLAFRMEFPGCGPLTISVNGMGDARGLVRGQSVKLDPLLLPELRDLTVAYAHDGLVLYQGSPRTLRGRNVEFRAEGMRISLDREDELVWTWRRAWRDSEAAAGIESFVFVENPERFGDELEWLLFLALNLEAARWRYNSPH